MNLRSRTFTLIATVTLAALTQAPVTMAAMAGATIAEGDTIALTPAYKTGQTMRFGVDIARKEKTAFADKAGVEQVKSSTHAAVYDVAVIEASESGTTFGITLSSLKSTAETPGNKYEYESARPEDDSDAANPVLRVLRPLVGATITIKFDARGNILDCAHNAELLRNSPYSQLGDLVIGEQWARTRWAPVLFPRDPAETTKSGETWKVSSVLAGAALGTFVADIDYKVASIKGGKAEVTSTGTYTLQPPKETEKSLMDLKSSSIKGTATFDAQTGLVSSDRTDTTEMAGSIQGISLARSSETNTKVTRLKTP